MKKWFLLIVLFCISSSVFSQILLDTHVVVDSIEDVNMSQLNLLTITSQNNTVTTVFHYSYAPDTSYRRGRPQYDSAVITRYTIDGSVIWQKSFSFYNKGAIYCIDTTSDGGYILASNYDTVNAVVKLDMNGNLTGTKTFPNPGSSTHIQSIHQLPNGKFLFGITQYQFIRQDVAYYHIIWPVPVNVNLYKIYMQVGVLNSNGDLEWIRTADSTYMHFDINIQNNEDPLANKTILHYDASTSSIHYVVRAADTINSSNTISLRRYNLNGNLLESKLIIADTLYNLLYPGQRIFQDYNNIYNGGQNYFFRIGTLYFDSARSLLITDVQGNPTGNVDISFLSNYFAFTNITSYSVPKQIVDDSDGNFLFADNDVLGLGNGNLYRLIKFNQTNIIYEATYPSLISDSDSLFYQRMPFNILVKDKNKNVYLTSLTRLYRYKIDSIYGPTFGQGKYRLEISGLDTKPSFITLRNYIDLNNNHIRDVQDSAVSDYIVRITKNNVSTDYPISQYDAPSYLFLPFGDYTIHVVSYTQGLKYMDASPVLDSFNLSDSNRTDSILFQFTPRPNIQDLQVQISPITNARPGFNTMYALNVSNVGTKDADSVVVKFVKDYDQTFDSFLPLNTTHYKDTLYWYAGTLYKGYSQSLWITVRNQTPPLLNAGDTLDLIADVFPIEEDSFLPDNHFELKQLATNSADPNEKSEAHGAGITPEQLQSGEYLYYTIRFQNTGNTPARKIKITDTLSDKLDWNTIEILNNSNNLNFKIENKRYLIWWSDDFYLPDSTSNEPGSHGYISFRVKPKAGLATNDVIENRAHIYFDYNAPVATNTAITQILQERVTYVPYSDIKAIRIYPSPTESTATLEFDANTNLQYDLDIVSISGQIIHRKNVKSISGKNNVVINLQDYAFGIYYIRLSSENQILYYAKILKE